MPNRAPTPAKARVDRLTDPEDANDILGQVDTTQPLNQRPGNTSPLVKATPNHTTAISSVQANVRMVENQRRHHLLAYESDTWHGLTADLADAEAALTDDQLVAPEIIRKLQARITGWALQRGLNGDQGAGA